MDRKDCQLCENLTKAGSLREPQQTTVWVQLGGGLGVSAAGDPIVKAEFDDSRCRAGLIYSSSSDEDKTQQVRTGVRGNGSAQSSFQTFWQQAENGIYL